MKTFEVVVTFTEPLLGTAPLNKELYADYIATRAPDASNGDEELETVAEQTEKGTTGFHRVDGAPILYDYMVKGFCKDAAGMLRRVTGTQSAKLKAYKKSIDGLLFVTPRRIPLTLSGEISILERPLRAQTAQGERIALARSEMAPAGTSAAFTVRLLGGDVTEACLQEWLDYGALRGIGQWRNASYGRFEYTITER